MEEKQYLELMRFSRSVAKAMEQAIPCKRIGMTVIGLEVPHTHVHLIPLTTMEDARFMKKETLDKDQFESIAAKIASFM